MVSQLLIFPQLEESGFLTVVWNPESGIRNPESVILGVGIRNTAERIQNPTNDWNPESTAWNSVPKTVLDSLKVMLHETIRNNDF